MPSYSKTTLGSCCDDPDYEHLAYWNEGEYAYDYQRCQTCEQKVRDVFNYLRVEALVEGGGEDKWQESAVGACCDDHHYSEENLERDEDDQEYLYAYTECVECDQRVRDVFVFARTEAEDGILG